jgi:hypothetical protein
LSENLHGKRLLDRSRRRYKDNINIDLKGIECEGVDWTLVVQDMVQWRALVKTIMKLQVP